LFILEKSKTNTALGINKTMYVQNLALYFYNICQTAQTLLTKTFLYIIFLNNNNQFFFNKNITKTLFIKNTGMC